MSEHSPSDGSAHLQAGDSHQPGPVLEGLMSSKHAYQMKEGRSTRGVASKDMSDRLGHTFSAGLSGGSAWTKAFYENEAARAERNKVEEVLDSTNTAKTRPSPVPRLAVQQATSVWRSPSVFSKFSNPRAPRPDTQDRGNWGRTIVITND